MEQEIEKSQKQSFEEKLAELKKITANLSQEDASLEKSLQEFEKGVILSKECSVILQKAEQKIKVLLQDEKQNNWEEKDYTE